MKHEKLGPCAVAGATREKDAKRLQFPMRKRNSTDAGEMGFDGPPKLHPARAMAANLGHPTPTMATHDSVTPDRKVQSDSSESDDPANMQLTDIAEALILAAEGRATVANALRVMTATSEQQVEEEPSCTKVAKRQNPTFRK